MDNRIARVFPRKTAATPTDELVFFDIPPLLFLPEIDVIHISVTFTEDIGKSEWLEKQWRAVGVPIFMGGPAFNEPGGEFIPGRYLKTGYTITSRGCQNRCWFCSVPKREGYMLRELQIQPGWNILDDNLLGCSDNHIQAVFKMLSEQSNRPIFSGGLEARLLKPWQAEKIKELKTQRLYMAYDTSDDLEPLIYAGKILRDAGISQKSHVASCYVLVGYPNDTFLDAEKRLNETIKAGFFPYAMLYKDTKTKPTEEWKRFQREWCRPEIVANKILSYLSANTIM